MTRCDPPVPGIGGRTPNQSSLTIRPAIVRCKKLDSRQLNLHRLGVRVRDRSDELAKFSSTADPRLETRGNPASNVERLLIGRN
jgi:hypothetical protein